MILDLEESSSENTQTPCRAVIATRITWQTAQWDTNWIWCKISAFLSNLAITQRATLFPGQTVRGIIGATYGTHLTAQLEAWQPCDWWDWDKMADHPAPDWEDLDLNPLTRRFLPVLGGSAWFDETWQIKSVEITTQLAPVQPLTPLIGAYTTDPKQWSKSLCSFRALPPNLDPHDYFAKRQEDLRIAKEKKNATIDPNTPEPEDHNKRGTSRGKSINRYRNIQQLGQNETASSRETGEKGVAEERGRSRHRR